MGIWTMTVDAHQRAVMYEDGQVIGVLDPGRYRRRRRTRYSLVDVRAQTVATSPQELLTADGITVKATASITWRVVDPVAYEQVSSDPASEVYLSVQLGLRDQLAAYEVADLARQARVTAAAEITTRARQAAGRLGIEVLTVAIKDVMLPSEVRAAYAELVATRQRGQARLESARAETAALRSLANAAKLLDDHPALARLRMIEAAPYGTKVELTLP